MNALINLKLKSAPSTEELLASLLVDHDEPVSVSFVNPYSYQILAQRPDLLNALDHLYCDGVSGAKLLSWRLKCKIERVSFDMTSLAPIFFRFSEENNLRVYLLGANQKEVEGSRDSFLKTFPKLNVVGARNGYFSNESEMTKACEDIFSKSADVVIVGMGTPKQEEFIKYIKSYSNTGLKGIFTCGGFIHQSSLKAEYYPYWINKLELRWLYRLLFEPHSRKRVFKYYPKFLINLLFSKDSSWQ
ncbi:WecB/TagA/CpsF family glycosyltransferase [Bowmanella denitrificans]|uniref:WecB/TagA/CpsF family glycosyltransferase n=1 Tax=Bowmanella denitrificans TaxID=366582 RepID=A0ABN0X2J6_9ALTE